MDEAPTAGQVHNGLISIIGWIQLLQRRIKTRNVDLEQVETTLARLDTLSKATEQKFTYIQNQIHVGEEPEFVTGVASSVVAEVGYGQTVPVLSIQFQSGRIYHYYDVPDSVYQELMASESKGQYFNSNIRHWYPFKRATPT